MTILITGVAGLIGSRLADYIIEHTGHRVIGIDDLSGGYIENVNDNVKFYQRDLSYDDISDIFKTHNIDVVYHRDQRDRLILVTSTYNTNSSEVLTR